MVEEKKMFALEKLGQTVNEYFNNGEALTEGKLLEEMGRAPDKRWEKFKENALNLGLLDFIEHCNKRYYFPAKALVGKDTWAREKLVQGFARKVEEEQAKRALLEKQTRRKEWDEKRNLEFVIPFIRCQCSNEISLALNPFYLVGKRGSKKIGLETLAGTVTCVKCGKQLAFGSFWQTCGGQRYLNDPTVAEGFKVGILPINQIPKEKANTFFTSLIRGLKPEFERTREFLFL